MFMVDQARYRDRVYFCSDDTAARALGVTRRTIIRWRCQLERQNSIVRCGWHRFGPRCKTVVYRVHVTQRFQPETFKPSPSLTRSPHYVRRSLQAVCTRKNAVTERPQDEVWNLLEELFGPVRTKSERGRRNRAVSELREAGATLLEIRQTYRYCQRKFSTFGEMAICSNLSAATSVTQPLTLPEQLDRLRQQKQ